MLFLRFGRSIPQHILERSGGTRFHRVDDSFDVTHINVDPWSASRIEYARSTANAFRAMDAAACVPSNRDFFIAILARTVGRVVRFVHLRWRARAAFARIAIFSAHVAATNRNAVFHGSIATLPPTSSGVAL